ncbi:hypothetical protein BJF78_19610 [Pseudonocardia sp. CNS-139]|nr:hypothetical protein BJF78_19610 [Pseudonocardia sp. CNS-139]
MSFAVFVAVQFAVPRARWNGTRAFGPGNIAMLLFTVQLLVLPVLLATGGPSDGDLLVVPEDHAINVAMMLQALAYAGYAAGYAIPAPVPRPSRLIGSPSRMAWYAGLFLAVGLFGLVLAFPTPGDLIAYFSGQGDVFLTEGPSTLGDAAASFFRPFLPFAILIVLAVRIARREPRTLTLGDVALGVLAVLASATNDYNRASVAVPVLALLTAYSCTVRRLKMAHVVVAALLLVGLAYQFGEYRSVYMATQGGRISATDAGITGQDSGFLDSLQLYANGPQFWGTVVQEVELSGYRGGETLVGSALLPVPVLGEPYRADSGPVEYNKLIYGRPGVDDQVIGFGAELYWNFGAPAVALGYLLLGLGVRRFDDLLSGTRDPLASYCWAYCGIWLALLTINSISVVSQIAVYFGWPVLALVLAARLFPHPRVPEVQR